MLRYPIKHTDFNDDEVEDVLYFNLSEAELLAMEATPEGSLEHVLNRIVEARDAHSMVKTVEDLILSAYGVKSDDGKRFDKNEKLRTDFKNSAAYQALFIKLTTDDREMISWLSGVLPKGMREELLKAATEAQTKAAQTNPTPPTS